MFPKAFRTLFSFFILLSAAFSFLAFNSFAKIADAQAAMSAEEPVEEPADDSGAGNLPAPQIISYTSNGLSLKGYLYKPAGNGPFPAYIWNHGSEQEPKANRKMAKFWNDKGFVFFAPVRSGHGGNPGPYIVDEEKALKGQGLRGPAIGKAKIALHEKANEDVVNAIKWLKTQPFVDAKRIVVAGGSYGGIQTVLTAESDAKQKLGVKCFVAMSPAAMSWGNGALWGPRLIQAVKNSKAPIFLLQAQNDYNLGPSEVVGPVVDAKGAPSRHKIFPPHNDPTKTPKDPRQQGHGLFFGDPSAWSTDVMAYLKDCGETK